MFSVSCTTRPPRATESPGKCYDFITEAEFKRRVAQGEFLEYAQVFGRHWYGTPRKWVDDARRRGTGPGAGDRRAGRAAGEGKVAGGRGHFHRAALAAGCRSGACARAGRIPTRPSRGVSSAPGRRWPVRRDYDFVVVNDDLERASDEVRSIVVACRCRRRDNDERLRKILETFGGY